MEKYDIRDRLFYDGYDIDNTILADPFTINNLLLIVNEFIFNNKGKITMIPYFNGKMARDGGVSGIILGDNFHFTCHTFCYKGAVFVDYYGPDSKKKDILKILRNVFNTDNYDMGSKDTKGNFGKHIIIKSKVLSLDEAINMMKRILEAIDMTPITNLLVYSKDSTNFDILQPIAESHISIHRNNDMMVVDAFSCNNFDVNKFINLFGIKDDFIEVNRGLKYRR